jgi:hypothetical protein
MSALDSGRDGDSFDLAGPELMTYAQFTSLIARLAGRPRPLWRVPLPLVHLGLSALYRAFGETSFATWQEAELMQVPMTSPGGSAGVRALGVNPASMAEVLSTEDPAEA